MSSFWYFMLILLFVLGMLMAIITIAKIRTHRDKQRAPGYWEHQPP